jgi:GTP-binding protein HflX
VGRENLSLEELERMWLAQENLPSLFISAKTKLNLDKLRETIFTEVRKIVSGRYPENRQ